MKGEAILCNTSFNSLGKPIINSIREALSLLDAASGLDYLVVDDWLFPAAVLSQ